MSDRASPAPPLAAMALGMAGLLPLAGVIVLQVLVGRAGEGGPHITVVGWSALGYSALILSFLGGMWWSAACTTLEGARLWKWLGIAVVPSLWALASLIIGWLVAPIGPAVLLAFGVLLTLPVDRAAVAAQLVPRWWMRLRTPLSLGLATETLIVGWLI